MSRSLLTGSFLLLVCVFSAPAAAQVNWQWILLQWLSVNYANFTCQTGCGIPISWDAPQFVCNTNGDTIQNSICTTGTSRVDCNAQIVQTIPTANPWGVAAAGECGCPSGCSNRGTCTANGCVCLEGYGGDDCASVVCPSQKCGGHGVCTTLNGFDTCGCTGGYATNDCSAFMAPLPPIPPILPYPQYTDKDDYKDKSPIFNQSDIALIHITLPQEDFENLLLPANMNLREYVRANFTYYSGGAYEFFEGVGFRVKGGASRAYAKKSWKVSLNSFEHKGRTWAQQKKINFKSGSMTPDFLREPASAAAIYSMGAPVYRVSYANVFINGLSWGTYFIYEDPARDEFLKSRFGNSKGSLWKCQGDLTYVGDDPNVYRDQGYKAANDNADLSYAPLAQFIYILNFAPDDQFEQQIQTIFNVEFFLRTFAAEVMTGNWDGIFNGNNYMLYYNEDSLFYYYRYDLDMSLGMTDFVMRDSHKNIWNWGKGGRGVLLISRILAVPSFQAIYATYLTKLMGYVNPDPSGLFVKRMTTLQSQIRSSVQLDYWRRLDNMFSFEEFQTSLTDNIIRPNVFAPNPIITGPQFNYGISILSFLEARVTSATQQILDGPSSQ